MDPQPRKFLESGISPERQLYYDTLMRAEELGNRLVAQSTPDAQNLFYRVSHPAVINQLRLPIEFYVKEPEFVTIEFDEKNTETGMIGDTTLIIEFKDEDCRIPLTDTVSESLRYYLIPTQEDGIDTRKDAMHSDPSLPTEGSITRREISDIISRAVLPFHDPTGADYTNINAQAIRSAIQQTLEEADGVRCDAVRVFDLDGHIVMVSTTDGYVNEVIIEQPAPIEPNDDYQISLRTEFDHHASSQEIVVYQNGHNSYPRAPLPEELEGFLVTMNNLINQLNMPAESFETLLTAELTQSAKRATEERSKGGKSPAD